MKNKTSRQSLRYWTWLSLGLLAIAFLVCRLIQPIYWEDVWWHMGVGEFIVSRHRVPVIDPFSWTAHGAAWTNTEWLYEVILYGVVRVMGLSGIIALKIALVFAALYFLDRRLRLWNASAIERIVILSVAFLGGWPFWVERADLSSLALMSALFFEMDRLSLKAEWQPWRALVWIVLFALWPNIHGAFPAGLVVIGGRGVFLLSSDRALGRRVLLWAFGCAAATLLNPYGIGLYAGIYRNLSAHVTQLDEWLPPEGLRFVIFYASLGLTAASFAFQKKRSWDDAYAVWMVAIFASYTLRHARFVHFFMICAFPYTAMQWLHRAWRSRLSERLARWEKPALALTCLALVAISAHNVAAVQGGVDKASSGYVNGACDFIASQRIQGPFYNDYKFGSFWIWRFKGDPPVFQDGRQATIVGYDHLIDATLTAQRSPQTWTVYIDGLGIQAALVKYPSLPGGIRPAIFDAFFPRTAWGLVYWDDLCLIFVRRTPRTRALLARWEYRVIKPEWTLETFLDQLRRGRLDRRRLRAELDQALALNPDCWRARVDAHWLERFSSPRKT